MLGRAAFAPITNSLGFVRCPIETVAAKYSEWLREILHPDLVTATNVANGPVSALRQLLPLTSPVSVRSLWMATTTGWSVYLDNARRGTDAGSVVSVMSRMCGAVGVRAVAQSLGFEATILEVFGETGAARRSIFAANDGGRWKFGQTGEPLPFEDLAAYARRPLRSRFTQDMLRVYLAKLEIHAFQSEWYVCERSNPAILVERSASRIQGLREFPLDWSGQKFEG